jgi:hypothetical protein
MHGNRRLESAECRINRFVDGLKLKGEPVHCSLACYFYSLHRWRSLWYLWFECDGRYEPEALVSNEVATGEDGLGTGNLTMRYIDSVDVRAAVLSGCGV